MLHFIQRERKKSTTFCQIWIVCCNWRISPRIESSSSVIFWREILSPCTFRRRSSDFLVDKCHFSERILSFSLQLVISHFSCEIKLSYNLTLTFKRNSGRIRPPNSMSRFSRKIPTKSWASGRDLNRILASEHRNHLEGERQHQEFPRAGWLIAKGISKLGVTPSIYKKQQYENEDTVQDSNIRKIFLLIASTR